MATTTAGGPHGCSGPSLRVPIVAPLDWCDRIEADDWCDRTDHWDWDDSAEPIEVDDPIDNSDANEPTLPTDAHDPMLPIDSTDPVDAIDSVELRDHSDQRPRCRLSASVARWVTTASPGHVVEGGGVDRLSLERRLRAGPVELVTLLLGPDHQGQQPDVARRRDAGDLLVREHPRDGGRDRRLLVERLVPGRVPLVRA